MNLIETNRLRIREFNSSDCAMVHAYANDSLINHFLGFDSIATEEGAKDYIETAISNSQKEQRLSYKLAMEIKPNQEIAGSCWLDISDLNNPIASIGYFVNKHQWGKGYATEMVYALLEFAFHKLTLNKVWATCDADNIASRKVLEKIGFKQEGLLRQHCLRSFGWTDVFSYGILRSEFK
jgi:ribosomal-protein-alanine N-acetyltransferase